MSSRRYAEAFKIEAVWQVNDASAGTAWSSGPFPHEPDLVRAEIVNRGTTNE
jgi:hypothetical protein